LNAPEGNAPVGKALRIVVATLCALLASRVLVLLFAARPDNPGVMAILWLTQILTYPVAWIDTFQPVYGARFERGTLLECVILLGVMWYLRSDERTR
jgi:hypothetical protein